jgi:hypothetical protein
MSLFHFQVRTDTHVLLAEGVELETMEGARVEAARRIGALLSEHAAQLWVDEDWRMDVTDARGLILFVIQVSALRSAATSGN